MAFVSQTFTTMQNVSETRASIMTGLWHQQSQNLKKPGHVTMAEVLRDAGYRTFMSGKWHLAGTPPDRGFDRYFGFLSGCINFFTGVDWQTGENLMRLGARSIPSPCRFLLDRCVYRLCDSVSRGVRVGGRPVFLVPGPQRSTLSATCPAGRHQEIRRTLQDRLGYNPPTTTRSAA